MQLNQIINIFAESSGLTKESKKKWALFWFGLEVNEKRSEIFIESLKWIWKRGKSKLRLAKYKIKEENTIV